MANVAPVEDGKVVDSTSSSSTASKNSSVLGKDDFLQLLVAQMKYQDPLEPTSNTEYIQQYSTYSQLEQMMNMSESMDLQRASGMVGQTVHVDYKTETGADKSVEGVVDFVKYENGTPYVSINGELYKAEDVTYVYDATYVESVTASNEWLTAFNKLPVLDEVTIKDYDAIAELYSEYSQFTDYTKGFIDEKYEKALQQYVDKAVGLKTAEWKKEFDALPKIDDVTMDDYDTVANLYTEYSKYSDYAKTFIDDVYETKLQEYVDKVVALKKEQDATS